MKNYRDVLKQLTNEINAAIKGLEDLEKRKDGLSPEAYNMIKVGYIIGVEIATRRCMRMSNVELSHFSTED